jgi:CTP synthase
MFCQVESEQVLAVHNVQTTYHVPQLLEKQGLLNTLGKILNLDDVPKSQQLIERGQRTWVEWRNLTSQQERLFESVTIALVGKYVNLHDSYLSVIKALEHSAMRCGKKLNLIWINASDLEEPAKDQKPANFHKAWHSICTADGILVPGGFGSRGIEGMIAAAKYARENKRPYLGICLGMQIAVIEFARNICNIPLATSEEIGGSAEDRVVIFMPEIEKGKLGGTMRLGLRPTTFQDGSEWSRLRKMYGEKKQINERHRHRYEVNPAYIERLSEKGFEFIGKDDKGERMEIIELKDHPWFVGVQYHPEYLSRVLQPSKPYLGFVAAAAGCLEKVTSDCLREYGVNGSDELVNGLNGVRI